MYQAIIAKIVVRPHPNADKIQLGTVVGHQVIVGKAVQTGDIGIFFPPDGQLSEEYAKANKLMKEDGGYLDSKRRVKALRLRGEKSEGLFMPLTSLDYLAVHFVNPDVGYMFTDISGHPICNKYVTEKTRSAGGQSRSRTEQKSNMYFKKHYDTPQWRFFKDQIPDNAYISITEKLHGTSGRYGRVLTQEALPLWKQFLQKRLGTWFKFRPNSSYQYHNGTRNVILDSAKIAAGTSYYGNESFRFKAVEGIEL